VREALVIDSSVFVAHFWTSDEHHDRAEPYIAGIEKGDTVFHIPTLAIVEICAVVTRRVSKAVALAARLRLEQWAEKGLITVYELDKERAYKSANAAMDYRLRGADAVFLGLAEELGLNIITFDSKSLAKRYPGAVVPV